MYSKRLRCLKKAAENSDRCIYHPTEIGSLSDRQIEKNTTSINQECPVCLETFKSASVVNTSLYVLACGHGYHKKCLEGLTKFECPSCRAVIDCLPDDLVSRINDNMVKYKRDIENDNFLQAVNMMDILRPIIHRRPHSSIQDLSEELSDSSGEEPDDFPNQVVGAIRPQNFLNVMSDPSRIQNALPAALNMLSNISDSTMQSLLPIAGDILIQLLQNGNR